MCRTGLFITILFFVMAGAAHPVDIHVPKDYSSIQSAVNAASNGDNIIVAPGVYKETVDFISKDIMVRSSGGAGVTSILSPINGMQGECVKFINGETAAAALQGFTITDGFPAIQIVGASPTVTDNVFKSNWNANITVNNGDPLIERNIFKAGLANEWGLDLTNSDASLSYNSFRNMPSGSVRVNGASKPDIHHNTLRDQHWVAIYLGPGPVHANIHDNLFLRTHNCAIQVKDGASATITDNDFIETYNNIGSAAFGLNNALVDFQRNYCLGTNGPWPTSRYSFVHIEHGTGIVRNNLFCKNKAIYTQVAAVQAQWPSMVLENCTFEDIEVAFYKGYDPLCIGLDSIIWNWEGVAWHGWKAGISYSDVGPFGFGGHMNFTSDPLFVDPANGDYHLLAGSPCIDAPSAATGVLLDLDGNVRDANPDIGAYEFMGRSHWRTGPSAIGETMRLVFQGSPGDSVFLLCGMDLRLAPLPTRWGDLHLSSPFYVLTLGTVGMQGVLAIPFQVPNIETPISINTQALIGSKADATLTAPREITLGG